MKLSSAMNTLLIVILISVILLAICFAGLALNILLKKNGKFPETEIGSNKNMRKLGIRCTKQDEILRDREWKGKKNTKAGEEENLCSGCCGCGENA